MFELKNWEILNGEALKMLKTLPDNFVDTCITSPPYYGLRDYGTGHWEGGDPNCPHYRTNKISANTCTGHKAMMETGHAVGDAIYKSVCPLCGAVRVDEQIGLEETPEEYIEKLVNVFHEVKRVLKEDGTLWVNIGDTYASSSTLSNGIKEKDMIGIPWMLAFALRKDGWHLRQDIIWFKRNPLPEPVKDRCVKSHEYIFLLSKSPKYYFDYKSIQEVVESQSDLDYSNPNSSHLKFGGNKYSETHDFFENKQTGIYSGNTWKPQTDSDMNVLRNKRDVWSVGVNSFKGAHFATFPEKLIEPCILAGSPMDGIVLDVFNGSGTTGVVSLRHFRKYIGIELNSEYAQMTKDRLNGTFDEHKKDINSNESEKEITVSTVSLW